MPLLASLLAESDVVVEEVDVEVEVEADAEVEVVAELVLVDGCR